MNANSARFIGVRWPREFVLATLLVLVLRSAAIPVAGVGLIAAVIHLARGRTSARAVAGVVGLPILVGLLGVAITLGTLGRAWSGPAELLTHLAARIPGHPFSLIAGLNLGPNLCVTGSLSWLLWLLWLRAARSAGAEPSLRWASLIGVMAVPLSMAAALGALAITGSL